MIEDLVALVLLAALGWNRLKPVGPYLSQRLPHLGPALRAGLRHPYYRLALLCLLLMVVGWCGTLARLGWSELGAQLAGQPGTAPEYEREACYQYQSAMYGESGAAIDYAQQCPYRGQLYMDGEGYLSCRRHGRPPELPRPGRRP